MTEQQAAISDRHDRARRVLAWSGFVLMLVSFVWLQFLPAPERTARTLPQVARTGPISLVIIDAGHGGQDSGAITQGVQEKDLTLDVALRLVRLAQANGLATLMTRSGDETVPLATRAAVANEQRDCVFVSIHFDHGQRAAATGVGTFYAARQNSRAPLVSAWLPFLEQASMEPANLESQSLAEFVQQALVRRTQAFDRGARTQQFFVIANVRHPAVLIEGGFLSNAEDAGKLTREEYREELAVAISEGLLHYRDTVNKREAAGEPGT